MHAGDRDNFVIACIFGNEIFIVHSLFETITQFNSSPTVPEMHVPIDTR